MTSVLATPLDELEAVNEILGTGSESPISSIDEALGDASIALKLLRTTSVEVQTKGWFFNEEFNVPLAPTSTGEIALPQNILKIDTSGNSAGTNAVQRGTRLYNKTDRSYTFEDTVEVDWVLGLPFEELPASARNYITIRAARKFQDRYFGSDSMHGYTKEDEMMARVELNAEEIDSRDPNMLTDSTFMTTLASRS